jgi:hypothetical protein
MNIYSLLTLGSGSQGRATLKNPRRKLRDITDTNNDLPLRHLCICSRSRVQWSQNGRTVKLTTNHHLMP